MMEEKRYVSISPDAIRSIAVECSLHLSEDVVEGVAEDATYRLREIVNISTRLMRRCRRHLLRSEDILKGIRICNSSDTEQENPLAYISITEELCSPCNNRITILRDIPEEPLHSKNYKLEIKSEWSKLNALESINDYLTLKAILKVSPVLFEYFSVAVSCIVEGSKDLGDCCFADFKRNPMISPLLPFFTSFSLNVKSVSHDINLLFRLLRTVSALINNDRFCFLGYLKPLVSSVLYCVLEPLTASMNPINDHWYLRDYGSRILSFVVQHHASKNKTIIQYIYQAIGNILLDPTRPLCSHYGAIITANLLGIDAIKSLVCPNLHHTYQMPLKILEDKGTSSSISLKEDAFRVLAAILNSAEQLHKDICKLNEVDAEVNSLVKLYYEMSEVFGDSLALRVPIFSFNRRHISRAAEAQRFSSSVPYVNLVSLKKNSSNHKGASPRAIKALPMNLSFSLKGCQKNLVNNCSEYTHSQYFSLHLRQVFIGKKKASVMRHYELDFWDVAL